jgi:hypothetical protein
MIDLVAQNGTFICFNGVKDVDVIMVQTFFWEVLFLRLKKKIKRQISDFKNEMNHGVL